MCHTTWFLDYKRKGGFPKKARNIHNMTRACGSPKQHFPRVETFHPTSLNDFSNSSSPELHITSFPPNSSSKPVSLMKRPLLPKHYNLDPQSPTTYLVIFAKPRTVDCFIVEYLSLLLSVNHVSKYLSPDVLVLECLGTETDQRLYNSSWLYSRYLFSPKNGMEQRKFTTAASWNATQQEDSIQAKTIQLPFVHSQNRGYFLIQAGREKVKKNHDYSQLCPLPSLRWWQIFLLCLKKRNPGDGIRLTRKVFCF